MYGRESAAGRDGRENLATFESGAIGEAADCHPFLSPLLDLWQNMRGERELPRRDDLDPSAIGRLLPHMLLLEVLRDPLDFRYRICGEHFIVRTGKDLTGMRLSERIAAGGGSARIVFDALAAATEERRPRSLTITYRTAKGSVRTASKLILPFANREDAVGSLLVGALFE